MWSVYEETNNIWYIPMMIEKRYTYSIHKIIIILLLLEISYHSYQWQESKFEVLDWDCSGGEERWKYWWHDWWQRVATLLVLIVCLGSGLVASHDMATVMGWIFKVVVEIDMNDKQLLPYFCWQCEWKVKSVCNIFFIDLLSCR